MKKYLIPVFILSTFLSAHCGGCGVEEKKIIENVVYNIGTVKIEITPHSLILSNNETFSETFNYHTERWGDKDFIISHSGIYFYHLNDWKEPIECMDFKPTKNNSHVVDMTTANFEYHYQKAKIKELNNEDFVKFSFFNEEKTSIGFFFASTSLGTGFFVPSFLSTFLLSLMILPLSSVLTVIPLLLNSSAVLSSMAKST